MAFSASDFADDTDFERLVLERLGTHRVRVPKPGATFDARRAGRTHVIVELGAVMGAQGREELAQSLRPLGFGAAYKVLDQLVEHVLKANGAGGRLTFEAKSNALSHRPATLPVPLDAHPDLWDRLAALYKKLEEPRHAVTHRRAQVTGGGDLEVYDNHRRLIDTVSSDEIGSFAAAVHATAEFVIDRETDDRAINILAWHLNALQARHSLPALPATDPDAGRRLLQMNLVELDGGQLRFDAPRAKEIVDGQEPSLWDLQLYADARVFVGRWENVADPSAPFDFHPASPPPWLSEEISST